MSSIADYLLNSLWQTPLVLLVALLATRCVRRLGPAAVHRVSVAALLAAVILPACHVELFRWNAAVWDSFRRLLPGHTSANAAGHVQVTALPGAVAAGDRVWLSHEVASAMIALYGVATLYFAARVLWGLWQARELRRESLPAILPEPAQVRWNALASELGAPDARLCVAENVPGPLVAGPRTVLLPSKFAEQVGSEDLLAALGHELAHLRRHDFVKNIAYTVAMLPVAYHPCAWMIYRITAESRESVCDAISAEMLNGRRSYAQSLLRLASAMPAGLSVGALTTVGMFYRNTLERRVRTMMDKRKQLRGMGRVAAMSATLLLGVGALAGIADTHLTVWAATAASSSAQPKKVAISQGVAESLIDSKVQPKYPDAAKKDKVQGTVTLGLLINKHGKPTNLHVVKSVRKDVDESALAAVRQWRYKPYLLNGDPVAVETRVNVTYTLAD